ncbi:hypothetical protein NST17_15340 [Caldifermentibacillus hisashii]|uniref:Uncharacterized protein n=2 Tax=Bacillaceae TaxID=186817 RepID=A0ABU9K0A3_9BACI|nr:hypothetical protein [Caldibacillus thermoamylovorans]CEE02610.1 putative membrane protein [Caldibacillus thermoamylovorans]
MRGRKLERILYLMLASMLIFWTVFPAVSAFAYITPGTPIVIVPGKPITPGTPIQEGTFIIPGKVYEPGNSRV